MDVATITRENSDTDTMCLYVFSPSKEERLYQLQMNTLADHSLALNEHHVTVAEVFENERGQVGNDELPSEGCSGLRQQFHVMPGQFRVVLVVNESSVKLSAESCVSCEEVIMRIDNEPVEVKHSF